jgi:hypothetical protein
MPMTALKLAQGRLFAAQATQAGGLHSLSAQRSTNSFSNLLSQTLTVTLGSLPQSSQGLGSSQHVPGDRQGAGHEAAIAAVLQHLNTYSPPAVQALFRPAVSNLDRTIATAGLMASQSPAQSAFLSPIGILHLFREYFFELGSFLEPPVGHVWVSLGGTFELIEQERPPPM